MRWFAHDLRATKLRKIAPMYLNMLCAASGGKTNGDGSISSPPQGYTNVFPSFPSKEVRCFSQPHYKNNNHFFLTPFLCVFFGFLATPNPGPFWWLPLLHYMPGGILSSRKPGISFTLSRWTKSRKKKKTVKKSKEQKYFLWRCRVSN